MATVTPMNTKTPILTQSSPNVVVCVGDVEDVVDVGLVEGFALDEPNLTETEWVLW